MTNLVVDSGYGVNGAYVGFFSESGAISCAKYINDLSDYKFVTPSPYKALIRLGYHRGMDYDEIGYSSVDMNNTEAVFMGFRHYVHHYSSSTLYVDFPLMETRITGTENHYSFFWSEKGILDELGNDFILICDEGTKYIEIGYDGAYAIIRVNGIEIIKKEISLGLIKDIRFGIPGDEYGYNSFGCYIGDVYINNGEGTINNTFWGDTRIRYTTTKAEGALNTGFVAKSGGELLDEVNEWPSDKSASYIEGVAMGSQCSFRLTPEANTTPRVVQMFVTGTKMAESESGVKMLIHNNGTTADRDKEQFPIGSYGELSATLEADLNGEAWDWETLAATDFGIEIVP